MSPSVTQPLSTATCQRRISAAGRMRNQGTRKPFRIARPPASCRAGALLADAELRRRLPGRPGEEVVRVVLRHLARDVAGDDAVVGEELRDPLYLFYRQPGVEL